MDYGVGSDSMTLVFGAYPTDIGFPFLIHQVSPSSLNFRFVLPCVDYACVCVCCVLCLSTNRDIISARIEIKLTVGIISRREGVCVCVCVCVCMRH